MRSTAASHSAFARSRESSDSLARSDASEASFLASASCPLAASTAASARRSLVADCRTAFGEPDRDPEAGDGTSSWDDMWPLEPDDFLCSGADRLLGSGRSSLDRDASSRDFEDEPARTISQHSSEPGVACHGTARDCRGGAPF